MAEIQHISFWCSLCEISFPLHAASLLTTKVNISFEVWLTVQPFSRPLLSGSQPRSLTALQSCISPTDVLLGADLWPGRRYWQPVSYSHTHSNANRDHLLCLPSGQKHTPGQKQARTLPLAQAHTPTHTCTRSKIHTQTNVTTFTDEHTCTSAQWPWVIMSLTTHV